MTTNHVATTGAESRVPSGLLRSLRRIWAIGLAETRLFTRNTTILLTALGLPLAMVAFMAGIMGGAADGSVFTTFLVNVLLQWALLLVIYYNLTTIFVARREDGVFQRMSTGEATAWEAVVGAALPSVGVLLIQVIVGGVGASFVFGFPPMTNPLFVILAVLLGCLLMIFLAAWTSSFTATVEGAQYSTMPLFFALLFFSGVNFNLDFLPEAVQAVAERTPLHAVGDLVSLGMSGALMGSANQVGFVASWSEGIGQLGVLIAWCFVFGLLARSSMRFNRRR